MSAPSFRGEEEEEHTGGGVQKTSTWKTRDDEARVEGLRRGRDDKGEEDEEEEEEEEDDDVPVKSRQQQRDDDVGRRRGKSVAFFETRAFWRKIGRKSEDRLEKSAKAGGRRPKTTFYKWLFGEELEEDWCVRAERRERELECGYSNSALYSLWLLPWIELFFLPF